MVALASLIAAIVLRQGVSPATTTTRHDDERCGLRRVTAFERGTAEGRKERMVKLSPALKRKRRAGKTQHGVCDVTIVCVE
jgi:hypothetical protein